MEMFTSTWKKKAPFLAEVVAFTKLLLGWDFGDEGTHSFTGGRGSHTKAFQPHSAPPAWTNATGASVVE